MANAFATVLPPGYTAQLTSTVRGGNPGSQHYYGRAEDWHVYGPNGQDISNRGPDISHIYRAAAVQGLINLRAINPQKAQNFAWGNYFETSKGSGVRDIMHYDIGGTRASPGFGDPHEISRAADQVQATFTHTVSQQPPPAPQLAQAAQPQAQPAQQQILPATPPWETQQPTQQQPEQPQDQPAAEQPQQQQILPATPPWEAQQPAQSDQQPQQQILPATPPWESQPTQLDKVVGSPEQPPASQDATQQVLPATPPWETKTTPPATSQDATPQGQQGQQILPATPPWETKQPETPPADTSTSEQPSPWRPYPTTTGGFTAQPTQPVPTAPAPSITPPGTTLQDYAPPQDTSDTTPVSLPPLLTPPGTSLQDYMPPTDTGEATAVALPTLSAPVITPPGTTLQDYAPPQDTSDTTPVPLPTPSITPPGTTPQDYAPQQDTAETQPVALPSVTMPGYTGGESEATQETQLPEGGSTTPQQISLPAGSPITGHAAAAEASAASGLLTSVGQSEAGVGHMITGTAASLAAGYQAHIRQQAGVMDAIDNGQNPHVDSTDAAMQEFASQYRDASQDQRAQIRQQVENQINALPAPGETGFAQGAKTVGETLATPGDWLTAQGEKITPPPGYEDALSAKIGSLVGQAPAYVVAAATAGLPGIVGVAGMQTYSQAYQADIKAGYAPEDAGADAGLKALANATIMAFPMSRWVEALTPVEKRLFYVAATRMAADGVFMTSATQAQHLVDNIITQARLNPQQPLTQGMGDPKEMIATTLFGALPHTVGLARAGVHDVAVGQMERQRDAIVQALLDTQKRMQQREPPAVPAPAVDDALVQKGITTPPAQNEGGQLVRAADSLGNQWIGHAGVLVNEGQNPTVDAHFREAEQHQPVQTNTELKGTAPIDDLVTSTHVDATQGITWTGARETEPFIDDTGKEVPSRIMVTGHDTEGHAVEIPEERYAVLGQYGDMNHDTYLTARPGENPIVAVRDPSTGVVHAIAQGYAPRDELSQGAPGERPTLEEQDEALQQQQAQAPEHEWPTPGVEPHQVGAKIPTVDEMIQEAQAGRAKSATSEAMTPGEMTQVGGEPAAAAAEHPYSQVEIRENPQGGFDIETPLEGIQWAATREQAEGIAARYQRLNPEQAVAYEQRTGRNYAEDWRNNQVDQQAAQAVSAPQQAQDQAQLRVPRTQRQPGITIPDITDRPSLYRQAYRDGGYDPDVMVNRPPPEQIRVLSDIVKRKIGFRDIEIDPKMQPQKVIDNLLDAYRNLQWMAHALNYNPKAMSLNGKIKLRIEPFQQDRNKAYLGMFSVDPGGGLTIHMADRSNSFAHEWTHALDHFLIDKLANNPTAQTWLLSQRTRAGDLANVSPGTAEEAFAKVMNAIHYDRASEAALIFRLNERAKNAATATARNAAAARAQKLAAGAKIGEIDPTAFRAGATSRYHALPEELVARAHEAYVAHLVNMLGGGNEFITKGDKAYLSQATQRFNDLYPHAADRDAIFKAFNDLHQIMLRDGVLGHAPRADVPGDHDILDPLHWRNLGDPQADPQMTQALTNQANKYKTWRQRQMQGLYDRIGLQKAPAVSSKNAMRWLLGPKDAVTPYIYTNMGQLGVFEARYEKMGNKTPGIDGHLVARTLSNAMDKLGYRYGEGRLQATPFERLANRIAQVHVNKIDTILRDNGIDTSKISPELDKQLYDGLRGRDDQGNQPVLPANIQRAVGRIRADLQDFWYELQRSGVPVGMPVDEGYVPVSFDSHKISVDGQRAHDTINRAMGVDYETKQRQQGGAFIHEAYGDLDRRNVPTDVRNGMTQLAQIQEEMRQESQQAQPDPNKLAQLNQQQQRLMYRLDPQVRDLWAKQRADDWVYAVNDVPWGYKNQGGTLPSANPLKSRTLSAEARDMLHDYILTRPSESLPYYYHQLSRKIAFTQTFGPKGEVLDKIMDDLHKAGASIDDRYDIRRSLESAIGIMTGNEVTVGHKLGTWMRGGLTMALMGRAAWSTIAEPLVATMQTGDLRTGFMGFSTAMRSLMAELNLMKPNDRTEHLRDIASVLGITSTRLSEAMLSGRGGALLSSPGRLMANAYRRSGLTYITNANKVGAIASADAAMKIWSKQILDGRRGALFDPHGELRELGIPNAEHEDFAKWMTSRAEIPSLDEMTQTPQGQRWAEGVRRFMEKVVIEPTAAEKARGANSSLGRWLYGLQSYNFGFQRAVLNPAIERLFKAMEYERGQQGAIRGTFSGAAQWGMYALQAVAAMMTIQLPTTMIRQELFDKDRADQWFQDGSYFDNMFALAYSRLGLGGIADPLIQAISHIKYDHEVSSIALGAQGNLLAESAQDVLSWLSGAGGSPNTNTAAYRAIRGAYTIAGMPLFATLAAALPGGPRASYMLSLLGQYATSMSAADLAARTLVGPKGLSREPPTTSRYEQRLDFFRHGGGAGRGGGQQQQGGGGGSMVSGLLGLLDDMVVPASKIVSPWIARYVR